MKYIVQGYNYKLHQWETLPYWTADGKEHTEFDFEFMAVAAMNTHMEKWPCLGPEWGLGYRVAA